MQFYMEEDSDATPPLSRCLPETPIREKSHIDRIIGKFLYRIVLSGDCYSYDVMKHYNPEVKDNRKLTYWEDDQMTLDPDKFLELAPKGTYSFTQHGDYIRINYDLDASKIGGQGSDFKPEDDLRISNIKAGEAEYSEQKNGSKRKRGDASSANQFLITIPGNPPEDVYPFVDWDDASLQIVLSDSEHWVLNHRYLKVFNINISTHGDTKTAQIASYAEQYSQIYLEANMHRSVDSLVNLLLLTVDTKNSTFVVFIDYLGGRRQYYKGLERDRQRQVWIQSN
ncbi:hypothetical protein ABG067_007097 [Albugo candida]